MAVAPKRINKKRKFVADGVFFAELNKFFEQELAEDGYTGCEIRPTPTRTEIIIRATRTASVLGEKGQRIRELTAVIQKRFNFRDGAVELYAERVLFRGLSAIAQAESMKFKLIQGLAVRRAAYGVIRFVMESEAKGCEVIVSGKGRTQRAKAVKFADGYLKKSGQAAKDFTDVAIRHVLLKSGIIGIRVTIMLPWDPQGKKGPKDPLPDVVRVLKPKKSDLHSTPSQ